MVYPGSKRQLAKIFIPLFQKIIKNYNIKIYIEPFVGGANIFDKIKCEEKYGYDKSETLIALFNQGIDDISIIPEHGSREWWDIAKAQYKGEIPRTMEDWKIGAIQFFGSFGTRGFPGGFANNKKDRDYYSERYKNFKEQIETIKSNGGQFLVSNYKDIQIPDRSLVYCDPPYEGTMSYDYSFKCDFKHEEYWDWVRQISMDNYVICSEQQCPQDFEIVWSKELTRTLSLKNDCKNTEILCIYKNGLLKKNDFIF